MSSFISIFGIRINVDNIIKYHIYNDGGSTYIRIHMVSQDLIEIKCKDEEERTSIMIRLDNRFRVDKVA